MDSVLAYLSLFFCGAGSVVLLALWRKARARWEEGATFFKKLTKPVLVLATVGLLVYTASTAFGPGMSNGAALLAFVAGALAPWYLQRKSQQGDTAPAAGSSAGVLDAKALTKQVKASKKETFLTLSTVPVPVSAETTHTLLLGAGVADKAALVGALLDQVRERGDTAIVLDAAGAVLARHFDADTDFVLNPFDERCVSWSPVHEAADEAQAAAMARTLVPGEDVGAATQAYVAAVLESLGSRGDATHRDLLDHLLETPHADMRALLSDTPAANSVATPQRLESVRAELRRHLPGLAHLPADGDAFSVTQMLQAQHSGVLFVTYRDDQLAESRRLLSCVFDAASRAILNSDAGADHRIWFIVDDLASLDRLPSLEDLASKARRNGAGLVLGAQTLGDIRARYGSSTAETLLANLATRVVTRCADLEEASEVASLLGLETPQAEVELEPADAESKGLFRMSKPSKAAKPAKPVKKAPKKPVSTPVVDGVALVRSLTDGKLLLKLVGTSDVCAMAAPSAPAQTKTAGLVARRGVTPAARSAPVARDPQPRAETAHEAEPVQHRRATGRPLEEPVELVELEPVFASEADALLYRTRKTQAELRERAATLGIQAYDASDEDVEDIEFVDHSATSQPVVETETQGQDEPAAPLMEPEAVDEAQHLPHAAEPVEEPAVLEPMTPAQEPVVVEEAVVPMPAAEPEPRSPLTTEPEAPATVTAEPVEPRPARDAHRAGGDARPARTAQEGRPARNPGREGQGKAGSQKRPASAGPREPQGAQPKSATGTRTRPAGPAKGGKAHDMLRDLLR